MIRVQVRRYVRARSMDVGFGTQLLRGAGGLPRRGVLQNGLVEEVRTGTGFDCACQQERMRVVGFMHARVCMSLAKDGKRGTEARLVSAGARRRVATSTRARVREESVMSRVQRRRVCRVCAHTRALNSGGTHVRRAIGKRRSFQSGDVPPQNQTCNFEDRNVKKTTFGMGTFQKTVSPSSRELGTAGNDLSWTYRG